MEAADSMFESPEGEDRQQGSRSSSSHRPGEPVSGSASPPGEKLMSLGSDLRSYCQQVCRQQQQRIAEELDRFSGVIGASAEKLQEQEDARIAAYARSASGALAGAANYLREKELGGLLNDARGVASRKPELVVGGMFVAGVALARFLKAADPVQASTSPSSPGTDSRTGEGDETYVPLAFQGHRSVSPAGADGSSPLPHRVEAAGGPDKTYSHRRDTGLGQED